MISMQLERPAAVANAVMEIVAQSGRPQRPTCNNLTLSRQD
jgi:hypothetical protein